MKKILPLLFILISACGEKSSELQFFERSEGDYKQYVNQVSISQKSTIDEPITIENLEYPIQLTLFKDQTFYYRLSGLSIPDGEGTWEYVDGHLQLFASRKLFDMNIDILSTTKGGKDLSLRFIDRFGLNIIPTEISNKIIF